jgi:hypothetical protein
MTSSAKTVFIQLQIEARRARAELIAGLLLRAFRALAARARSAVGTFDRLVHLERSRRACLRDPAVRPEERARRELRLRLGKWDLFWDYILARRDSELRARKALKAARTRRIIARSRRQRRHRARPGMA